VPTRPVGEQAWRANKEAVVTTNNSSTNDTPRPLIIVGVDGSAESLNAVVWGAAQARATGGTLELLTTWAYPRSYGTSLVVSGADLEGTARDVLEKAATDVDLPPERLIKTLVRNAAPPELVRRSHDADLIVVGHRGHGGFSELVLGSVSTHLTHHATCPVVVVR
jgi:nucleotide-binding universal stress UspA family protein